MSHSLHNVNELKFLWKIRGNKNYDLRSFHTNDGVSISYILFEDSQNRRNVFGKIVINPREGEAYHWPRLQHENLAPLLDTVSINEKVSIYILPAIGYNLKDVIHSKEFMMDMESFNRKRAYVKDILSALEYLHSKFLCVMNLTNRIINISSVSDKAILCDFHSVHLVGRTTKEDIDLPILYQAPEIKTECFDPISVEIWACGVMFLQIFTNDVLPSAFIGEEVQRVVEGVEEINYDIIKESNPGAEINFLIVEELKSFLSLFLTEDPKLRINVRKASESSFLNCFRREEIKEDFKNVFWKPRNNFEFHRTFDKPEWMRHRRNLVSPFEDMYLKEIAICRDKLKKLPCTNKFINLKFVPHGDNVTKYPENNKTKNVKRTDMTICDKENPVEEQMIFSKLQSEDKSREPLLDNKIISMVSDKPENFKSSSTLDNTNNLNLGKISSNFGDIRENIGKEEIIHSFSALYKIDDIIKSSIDNETNNETEIPMVQLEAQLQLSSYSDVSLDSLESYQNNIKQVNDTYTKPNLESHDAENSSSCDLNLAKNPELGSHDTVKSSSCDSNLDTKSEFELQDDIEPSNCDSNLDANIEFRPHGIDKSSSCNLNLTKNLELESHDTEKSSSCDSNLDTKSKFELHDVIEPSNCDSYLDGKLEFISHGTVKSSICDSNQNEKLESESHDNERLTDSDPKLDTKTEKFCTLEDATSSLAVINSISKDKTACEQNSSNVPQLHNDSCINNTTDVEYNNSGVAIPPLIENNYENRCLEPETEQLDPNNEKPKVYNTHVISQNDVSGFAAITNYQADLQNELIPHTHINQQIDEKDNVLIGGNLHSFNKNAEEVADVISITKSENAKQIVHKDGRNDSYKMAILNGLKDAVKHETLTPVEEKEVELRKKKIFISFIFSQKD